MTQLPGIQATEVLPPRDSCMLPPEFIISSHFLPHVEILTCTENHADVLEPILLLFTEVIMTQYT